MFYAGSPQALRKQIEQSFLNSPGPGKIPAIITPTARDLIGVIVPHAGLMYSGGVAAHAYQAIAEQGFADTFILLGPNHHGVGSGVAVYPDGAWETPFGSIPIDTEIVSKLSGGIIDSDESTHQQQENSIEVQLPFLQYLAKKKPFSIVPIIMSMQDYETSVEVGMHIAQVLKESKKSILILASSDFSHEGISYGRMPPDNLTAASYAKQQDDIAINHILAQDAQSLAKSIETNHITMCGYGPIIALMTIARIMGAQKATLLKYNTSHDISPNNHACVGYGAFAFYK